MGELEDGIAENGGAPSGNCGVPVTLLVNVVNCTVTIVYRVVLVVYCTVRYVTYKSEVATATVK